jgi:hypothetical protein
MVNELSPWVYVNDLLIRTEEAKQAAIDHFAERGEAITVRSADQASINKWVRDRVQNGSFFDQLIF